MLLYHGTSSKALARILEEGILPRKMSKAKGNFAHTIQSHINRVYLTDAYAPYFASIAAAEDHSNPVVVVVDTDKIRAKLVADEDAIEQVDRVKNEASRLTKQELIQRTRRFLGLAEEFEDSGQFTYEGSLRVLGTCAVVGKVGPEAIVGYIELKPGKAWTIFDPLISLMNYKIKGAFYRHMSELLWLGKSDIPLSPFDVYGGIERYQKAIDDMILKRANVASLVVSA